MNEFLCCDALGVQCERTQPIKLFFSGKWYVSTNYTEHGDGSWTSHDLHELPPETQELIDSTQR